MLLAVLTGAAAASAQAMASGHGGQNMTVMACPWLTEGTAADALGANVTVTVAGNSSDGSCRFARSDGVMDFLEIHVGAGSLLACPPGSLPLRGVGNQAQRCRMAGPHGMMEEMASGSVRALHFTVTLTGRATRGSGKPSESDDNLARIADEVAGNLY